VLFECLVQVQLVTCDRNSFLVDETLPITNKPKHLKKGGNKRNKMEGPTSKKTKEPPKRANHKGTPSYRKKHIK